MNTTSISPFYAALIGHLVVNLPVLLIIAAVTLVAFAIGAALGVAVIIGAVVAWPYWSFATPRWRQWALAKGVDETKLQRLASLTLLTWPKGSALEKTELPPRE